jgi:hypothetical protein
MIGNRRDTVILYPLLQKKHVYYLIPKEDQILTLKPSICFFNFILIFMVENWLIQKRITYILEKIWL